MPFLTISDAARVCGVHRRTLQRAVQAGRLPLTAGHRVDTADLRRAGYPVPVSQLDAAGMADIPSPDTAPVSQVTPQGDAALLSQAIRDLIAAMEAILEGVNAIRAHLLPQADTAGTPHHVAVVPQAEPQADAAPAPHRDTLAPQEPATPDVPTALPAHVLRIAEVAAEYDKLTLVDLSQLLYDRGIYRSRDRTTGMEKPVHKGTLLVWLNKARQAGVL